MNKIRITCIATLAIIGINVIHNIITGDKTFNGLDLCIFAPFIIYSLDDSLSQIFSRNPYEEKENDQ